MSYYHTTRYNYTIYTTTKEKKLSNIEEVKNESYYCYCMSSKTITRIFLQEQIPYLHLYINNTILSVFLVD